MKIENLITVRNYINSVTLDSTGRNPSHTYVYQLIEKEIIPSETIDGVKFVYNNVDVEGITKLDQ